MAHHFSKRIIDIIFVFIVGSLLSFVMLVIMVAVKLTSPGPMLHWSQRPGQFNQPFHMPKFRTMYVGTPIVAPDKLENPAHCLTFVGAILRKTSLDELPQLWSILRGDMSVVGPRPPLFSEKELIELRTGKGIDALKPGLTGWAQINGRDTLGVIEKVRFDEDYLRNQSLGLDAKIMLITVLKVLRSENILH